MKKVACKSALALVAILATILLCANSTTTPMKLKFIAMDGKEVDLEQMRGKVVLIDCWATWCEPCLREMPHIKVLYDRYHNQGFEAIGISMDEPEAKDRVKRIIRNFNILWPQRFEGKGFNEDSFKKQYGIKSLPTLFLLDKAGNIGDINARGEHLEMLIKQYLEKP